MFDCQFLSEAVRIVRCKTTPRHCSYFESKETSSRARNRLPSGYRASIRNQICRTTIFLLLESYGCELYGRFLKACYTARHSSFLFPIFPQYCTIAGSFNISLAAVLNSLSTGGCNRREARQAFLFLTLSIIRQFQCHTMVASLGLLECFSIIITSRLSLCRLFIGWCT